ncbi:microtubule-actin cross-linking factor 1, isoforms 6/7-like [Phaenicophaeus curvirostris]|uniref:microtubule-actin cross-linking factor 1, isoforms 6/7-like n=1 Tax=Phaenicophaeus curvirostris TaxID=33595 RepID=UPI0037F0F684
MQGLQERVPLQEWEQQQLQGWKQEAAARLSAHAASPHPPLRRARLQEERPPRRLEAQEQLQALRRWLDALEKTLPSAASQEPPEADAAAAAAAASQLAAWVAEMEQLVCNQKAPSGEVKVATAQLEEQKLLQRLLDERRPHVERVLQDGAAAEPPGPDCDATAPPGSGSHRSLAARWEKLMQEAAARSGQLQRILPAAQAFQEAQGAFLQRLAATEMQLAQLGAGSGCSARTQDALKQSQALSEELRSRLPELDATVEHGQRLLQLVTGEEAQLVQEKLESLRTRYLVAGRSCADAELRLQQALEASRRLGAAQDDLELWLGRMEAAAAQGGCEMQDGDREELEQLLQSQLQRAAGLGERLEALGRVQLEAQELRTQLDELKLVCAEILHQRGLLQRLLPLSERLLSRSCDEALRQRLQELQERTEQLVQRSGACTAQLEQAQALLAQFAEAQEELQPWLQEAQAVGLQLAPGAVIPEALREQQALLQSLREALAEHRAPLAKLQRASWQLRELSAAQAAPFLQRCREAEAQFSRISERLGRAAALLEDALPRCSQLSERMELLRDCLERLRGRLQSQPGGGCAAALLQEQLRDNDAALDELEELQPALQALQAQGEELQACMRAADAEVAARALQERASQLQAQWRELRARGEERALRLRELRALAERVGQGREELAQALGATRALLQRRGEPGARPEALRAQLQGMQALRAEVQALREELDALSALAAELAAATGEKPQRGPRSIDQLLSAWGALDALWGERVARLEEQLQDACDAQDAVERLQEWLQAAELRVAEELQLGGDAAQLQLQLDELKELKRELQQRRMQAESLRPPGGLGAFRERCDRMEEELVGRQHRLEASLLGLGQLQRQLQELLQWLEQAAQQLQGPAPLRPDLQGCEIELAKHKVLRNDVLSHARTVQSVREAGQGLLRRSEGDEGLRRSLQQLEQRWEAVRSETESRQLQLENNLSQVQDVTLETTELLQWLEQVELQLFFSQPAWAQPDATKEKLNAHLELCKEMDSRQASFWALRERLQRLLGSCRAGRPCSTEHALRLLQHKWDSVHADLQERKELLAEALSVATEFQGSLQELQRWLERAEELLASPAPPSFVLRRVAAQIQEHKALLQEASAQGEKLRGLEAAAARLQGLSRKPDGAVAQDLLLRARERLDKLLQRAAERGAALEEARQRCKQFCESQQLLLDWMEELEQQLAAPQDAATTQDEIKRQLAELKSLQKLLRSKRPVLEATLRGGRALRERARLPEDLQPLELQLRELKERWDALGGCVAERQRQLEEQLLFSGKFAEALQALQDWLFRAEPQLSEDAPVAGDRDLVGDLMDKHKAFQKELGKRAGCMRMLKRSVRDLTRGGGGGDSQWLQRQLEELSARWDLVCALSVCRQARLEAALRQAEEFQTLSQSFLRRLADSEKALKLLDARPEDEAALQQRQSALQELQQSLQCQQLELECIASLGDEILGACHPDAVIAVRSCVAAATSRFQEVRGRAQQEAERLRAQASRLAAEREEASQLLDWIAAAEEALGLRDQEPLPDEAEALQELSAQHAVFLEELNRKQPDVERVTKSCKKAAAEPGTPAARRVAARRRSTGKAQGAAALLPEALEPQTPQTAQLLQRWQQLWLMALERQYRLETAQQRLRELEEFSHFDVGLWRRRYLQWIAQMKSRVLDVFRSIDRDQDGRVSLRDFVEGVLASTFPTNALEMNAVAGAFDLNGDGFIDYYEFVSALHPNRDPLRRCADAEQIQDEVNRQVAQCSCTKRFQVEQISANRYRFGESQQLRMVRILRSTLMVRVGGGWIALDEFLVKNDPCRVKGRTNLKINEKYLSADSFAAAARCSGNPSPPPPCKALSRSRSNSSLSLCSSSASAPSSPSARKSVLRRTRSGDRCSRSRSSLLPDGAELPFPAPQEAPAAAAPTEPPEGSPPQRRSPCR